MRVAQISAKVLSKMCIKLIIPPVAAAGPVAKVGHYAWTSSETVVQVHGQGPFAITYVNPADDPSKK